MLTKSAKGTGQTEALTVLSGTAKKAIPLDKGEDSQHYLRREEINDWK